MKKRRKPLTTHSGEVRELTKADIARMRPASRVVPEIAAIWRRSKMRRSTFIDTWKINLSPFRTHGTISRK